MKKRNGSRHWRNSSHERRTEGYGEEKQEVSSPPEFQDRGEKFMLKEIEEMTVEELRKACEQV